MIACAMVVGCSCSAETEPTDGEEVAETQPEIPQVPVVTETMEELHEVMRQYDQTSPEFDQAWVKTLVLNDELRKANGVEGFQESETPPAAVYSSPTVMADAESRRVAWRAMTCANPDCPGKGLGGGPYLFTVEFSWVTVGQDGQLVIGQPNAEEMNRPIYCPACKMLEFIRPYELPESAVRERALKDELNRAYSAYAAAVSGGQPMPTTGRTPDEITREMASLPKLYLLSRPGEVKQFDAITSPISAGLIRVNGESDR